MNTTPPCPPQVGNFQAGLEALSLSCSLKRLAVIGDPISHSLSPVLHNFLIAHFNVPFVYEALHVRAADLPKLVTSLRNGELAGVNVTIPHKQAIMPLLDELLYPADRIGAVNTVCVVNERLIGHNTDAIGFQLSLAKARGAVSDEQALVLGAGGAAKAVVFALLAAGAGLVQVCNRHAERAVQLRESLSVDEQERVRLVAWDERERVAQSHSIKMVINTTSLGMAATQSISPFHGFRKEMIAIDLIYNPAETCFLQQARQAGAVTLNGLPMLIYQGVAAMELWSGKRLEIAEVFSALEERMNLALLR